MQHYRQLKLPLEPPCTPVEEEQLRARLLAAYAQLPERVIERLIRNMRGADARQALKWLESELKRQHITRDYPGLGHP